MSDEQRQSEAEIELSDSQLFRYARNLVLNQISEHGQQRLLAAKVAVIGAGGLGAPLLMYLAASGVGTLSIIDHDRVELSNLQRQIIHNGARIGVNKALSAQQTISALNPDPRVIPIALELDASNAAELLAGHDLIIDGADNWAARLAAAQAAESLRIPLLSGAIYQFDGQVTLLRPYQDTARLTQIFPQGPQAGGGRCEDVGVFAPACGVVGSIMASEAIKALLDIEPSLANVLLMIDCLHLSMHRIKLDGLR